MIIEIKEIWFVSKRRNHVCTTQNIMQRNKLYVFCLFIDSTPIPLCVGPPFTILQHMDQRTVKLIIILKPTGENVDKMSKFQTRRVAVQKNKVVAGLSMEFGVAS